MDKYIDMRIFSLNHGGISSQAVKDEYKKRYNGISTIRLPFRINGANAFVVYTNEIVNSISSIYQLNTKLTSELKSVPGEAYKEYIIQSLVEEIQQSNEVEHVESTRQEIQKAYDNKEKKSLRFNGMVTKYNLLLSKTDIRLMTSSDIRQLYDDFILDEVVRENPKDYPDGEIFRKEPVHVYGRSINPVHDGLYPESQIIEAMEQALHLLQDDDLELLIRTAIFHFMFGYIHPFYNGNGRMSRFISSYMLSTNLEQAICLRLSYVINEKKSKYLKMFKETEDPRNMGDMTGFVTGFLQLIESACDDAFSDIQEKNDTYQIMKTKLDKYLHDPDRGIAEKYHKIFYYILEKTIFIGDGASYGEIISSTGITKITISKILAKADPIVYYRKGTREHRWYIKLTDTSSHNTSGTPRK